MHRYGFIAENVRREIRRIDFHLDPRLRNAEQLENCIDTAVACIGNSKEIANHILYQVAGKKVVARTASSSAKIALRLVNRNIHAAYVSKMDDRDSIVRSLKTLLSESVRYRVYKLDVKSFYESFDMAGAISKLRENSRLTDPVKRVLRDIFENHLGKGYEGLPRGLVISASLSDALMQEFDQKVVSNSEVFFYRRYVDDITIITSAREDQLKFIALLEALLPDFLEFKKQKTEVKLLAAFRQKEKDKAGTTTIYTCFDYLGYRFNIARDGHQPSIAPARHVWLDIADSKVKKIKTRLMKSYVDYLRTGDYGLLEMRVRHLTSNISLIDRSKGVRRLSGIHHSYPLVDIERSTSLRALDSFLKTSLISVSGSVFSRLNIKLTPIQKSGLARHSFYSGAKKRRFYQFNVKDLSRIQRCWKHG